MIEAEIIELIRRGIKEPSPRTISDTKISEEIIRGVYELGFMLKQVSSHLYHKRISLQSVGGNIHVFDFPSDLETILRIWDLDDNAGTITDATNASPIVITCAAHGFEDDDRVFIHGVLGNTAANGTWKVANKTTNTFELAGSTGNAAYTSGGKVFEEQDDWNTQLMERIPESEQTGDSGDEPYKYFIRGEQIIVDAIDYKDDIVLLYTYTPSAITDIPAVYHDGLVAFGVKRLIVLPNKTSPKLLEYQRSLIEHRVMWNDVIERIKKGIAPTVEGTNITKFKRTNQFI